MALIRWKGGGIWAEDGIGSKTRQAAQHNSITDFQGKPPKAYRPGRRCKKCGRPLNIYSKNVCNVCLNKD